MSLDFLTVVLAVGYDENPERVEYKEVALRAIKKYYDHFNIPMAAMTENHPDAIKTSPSMARLLVHELYDAKFILVQGLDMIPCNFKYDIRDFLELPYVNMAIDTTRVGQWPKECGFPHFKYNADMVGFPKELSSIMREIFIASLKDERGFSNFEQYYMNALLWEAGVYVHDIPLIFNRFYHDNFDYKRNAFCHYTNYMANRDKWKFIKAYHPREMLE